MSFALPAEADPPSDAPIRADVSIVGSGMVGMTMAAALGQVGIETVVIDLVDPARFLGEPYDGRASAVAHGAAVLFDGLGLWRGPSDAARLDQHGCRIDDIRVSDQASRLFLHYDHRDLDQPASTPDDNGVAPDRPPMGYIIENRAIRHALVDRLRALPAIRVLAPAALAADPDGGIAVDAGGVTMRLADGRTVRSGLLIGADGARSAIRQRAGIRSTGWDYDQVGIVCTAKFPTPHHNVAHERFLPAGPFALLPMVPNPEPDPAAPHRASIVWTERIGHADAMMALDDRAFSEEMTRRFGPSLGPLTLEGRRWRYPLAMMQVARKIGPRLALVGDAAHQIHPIAGQGLNLGLRDVAALAEVVVDAMRAGRDPGDPMLLNRYQRWRRFDTLTLIAATDGLNRLFSNRLAPIALARDLGLALVNQVGPAKRLFMRHAMGELGALPRLIRGAAL